MHDFHPGDDIFGLAPDTDHCRIHLLPVPFDATTSYHRGTADGPAAILRASAQLDLHDHRYGRIDRHGITMDPEPAEVRRLNETARTLADTALALGEKGTADKGTLDEINAAGAWVGEAVHHWAARTLERGRIPGLIGGEHSVSFGAIRAAAEKYPGLGMLQVDAHMDLRDAYLGMEWSHASIMRNVAQRLPNVARIVQVGIRDYSSDERAFQQASKGRIVTHFDADIHTRAAEGKALTDQFRAIIDELPNHVYVSFDIDGLDPSLCPGTGTPVPGGLSFNQAALLLHTLARSGKKVVAFDLVEVAQRSPDNDWDANVGMRMLYQLCGCAIGL